VPGIIDAWIQHPALPLSNEAMSGPLRRWLRVPRFEEALPLGAAISAMDAAGAEVGRSAPEHAGRPYA